MTTGQAILEGFYRAAGEPVRGADLARRLSLPAARVAKEVAALEALGYNIESHPHRGYRLLGTPDQLLADDLLARLAASERKSSPRVIGSEIVVLEETTSTNDEIERALRGEEALGGTSSPMPVSTECCAPVLFRPVRAVEAGGPHRKPGIPETERSRTTGLHAPLPQGGRPESSTASSREGLVVFAEHQTLGRGRHGRRWESPRGKGLWFSVLLRPELPPSVAPRITVAASVAVVQTLRQLGGVDARIKWPNDVTVGGKKLAGILTELRVEGGEISAAILGIGLDVNCQQTDFPPALAGAVTSLRLETGRAQDRAELAVRLLNALDDWYATAMNDFGKVTDEWARWCTILGRQLAVTVGARRIEGLAHALDGDGALLLRKDNGQVERILGGDMILQR